MVVKHLLLLLLLLIAAIIDFRKRQIPDMVSILVVLIAFLPPDGIHVLGLSLLVPLLIVACTIGGIGGGDIKLITACGICMGPGKAVMMLTFSLVLLLCFHAAKKIILQLNNKLHNKQLNISLEQAYPLAPFLMAGMLCIYVLEIFL